MSSSQECCKRIHIVQAIDSARSLHILGKYQNLYKTHLVSPAVFTPNTTLFQPSATSLHLFQLVPCACARTSHSKGKTIGSKWCQELRGCYGEGRTCIEAGRCPWGLLGTISCGITTSFLRGSVCSHPRPYIGTTCKHRTVLFLQELDALSRLSEQDNDSSWRERHTHNYLRETLK